ncbi:hypothetical protein Tco_0787626 [Tanacetum coccineum]
MMERELGEGYTFIKKKCFVCGSLSHLIKDCDYYEKKMAREAEFKKQRVFNTGNRVAKPVWTNENRFNHANQFVPKPVQLNAGRPKINSVRPNINTGRTNINSVRPNINTGRVNVNSVRPNVNTGRVNVNSVRSNVNTGGTNVNPVRPRVNTGSSNVNIIRSRQPVPTKTSNSFSPKRPQGNWGTAVKTSAGYNWRKQDQTPIMISSGDKDSLGDDASKQGRIDIGDINTDAEITLIDETQGRINDIIADEDITLIPKLIIKLLKM